MRACELGCAAAMAGTVAACAASPPVNPGYVSLGRPAPPGAVEGSVQGGIVQAIPDTRGSAALHVEPYLNEQSSLPVSAAYQETVTDDDRMTLILGRVGYRQRHPDHPLGFGFGIGPNYMRYGGSGDGGGRTDGVDAGTDGLGFAVDGEIIMGHRFESFGLSFVGRPAVSWNQVAFTTLWIPLELSFAVFPVESVGVAMSGLGGIGMVFPDGRDVLGDYDALEGWFGITAMRGAMVGVTWSTF